MELFSEKRILSVSQLTTLIKGVLEENFEHVWVEGEVSNVAQPGSGHLYFTLKDSTAQLRAVMFRTAARALRFQPKDGIRVLVRGRLTLFEPRGEYQLLVEYLEPQGVGALQLAFSQLKERLAREGLFDSEHKKDLPVLPQRIGVVTSATGAAIRDILHVLDRRYFNLEIYIIPVRVQGEGAAAEIAAAINDFNRHHPVDVLIVGRGGGSIEDLWAFNEEIVARAIYNSKIPVISAVGHEIDFTIADFVADLRAPTPSAAAELVIRSKKELVAEVTALSQRLFQSLNHNMVRARGSLQASIAALKDPARLVGHLVQRIDDLSIRLGHAIIARQKESQSLFSLYYGKFLLKSPLAELERRRESIISLLKHCETQMLRSLERAQEMTAVESAKLLALSPLSTLARGYGVIRKLTDKEMVKSIAQLSEGERLELILHDGRAVGVVEKVLDSGFSERSGSS